MVQHADIDHTGIPGAGGTPSFVGCVAQRTTDQTGVVTATLTTVSFTGTDVIDTDAFHDPGGANPSRLTVPSGKAGKYRADAFVIWDTGATGERRIGIMVNGAHIGMDARLGVSGIMQHRTTSEPLELAVGDYVEVQVYHTNGSNRTLSGSVVPLKLALTYLGA